jgi:two-component system chemotaxis response regulator CheY
MRALVVDDSSAMRAILRMALKKQGFEVAEAKHGVEALSTLEVGSDFDLILIDWNMPQMNGFELLRRIRSQPRYGPTKIMMVTTETGMSQMSQALEAGADDYIMKPFTFDVVSDKLRLIGL